MNNINQSLDLLIPVAKGVAAQFGDQCEVVLHDLTQGYESTIVYIENGHLTGRKVGDSGTNLGLEVLKGETNAGDRYNYLTQTREGKVLRSSSIYFRNKEEEVIGCLCINYNISDFIAAEALMKKMTMNGASQDINKVEEAFVSDVNELLDFLLNQCINEIGKPVSQMTKEDRKNAIRFLDQKGAFLIKKAGDKVCQFFDISKFTLYNLIDDARAVSSKK